MSKRKPDMDFEGDASKISVSDDDLKRLATVAADQVALEKELSELETRAKETTKKLDEIRGDVLPSLMTELGMESFVLADGTKVTVKKSIHTSITATNKEAAHKWLRDHGHGSLIKNQVTASFGRGEEEKAVTLVTRLLSEGIVSERKEAVHYQTLGAFVREQLSEGKEIPVDLFGIYESKQSKVEV